MKLLDLKTLSKEYSISIFTFRKFVKMGLPHYRLGRKILVNPDDFEEWFEKFKINSISAHHGLNRLLEENFSDFK
jgi:hypothetical protein